MKGRLKVREDDFLILLFFIGYWIRYFTELHIMYSLMVFCLVVFGVGAVFFMDRQVSYLRKFFLQLLMIDLFAAASIMMNGNHTLADLVLLTAWQSMGLLMFIAKEHLKFLRMCSLLSGCYLILIVLLRLLTRGAREIVIVSRTGENTISILLILFVGIDLWICEWSKVKAYYFYYVAAFFTTVLVGGIAGTITMGCLMTAVYLFKNKNNQSKLEKRFLFVMAFVIVGFMGKGIVERIISFVELGDWRQRAMMIVTYLELATKNLNNIFFGANIEHNLFLSHYRNLHNSFFNWHYFYGLLPCLFFVWLLASDLMFLIQKKQYMMMALVLIMALRAMTDETTYAYMMIWVLFHCLKLWSDAQKTELRSSINGMEKKINGEFQETDPSI